jgi:hypothetical protein
VAFLTQRPFFQESLETTRLITEVAEATEAAECFNMLSALVEIGASAQEDVLLIDPSWLPHLLGMELIETNADGTCKRTPLEECSEEVLLKLFGTGHDGVEPTEVGASAKGNEISGVPAYLTVADCLARLPVKLSERTFRKLVRRCGTFIEHRKQMPLTEDDFAAVLETMRPCSSSSSVPRVRTGKSEVRFAASEYERALARVQRRTLKQSFRSGSRKSLIA